MRQPLVEAALVHELAGGIPGQRVLWWIRRAPDPKMRLAEACRGQLRQFQDVPARLAEYFPEINIKY
jgi:hypothetical protein